MAFNIAYKNLLTDSVATVTASNQATGYEVENCYDGFGFDWWRPSNFSAYIDIDFADSDSRAADYVAFWGHDLGDHASRIIVQYWNGSAYVSLSTTYAASNNTLLIPFTNTSGTKWRIYVQTAQNLLLWSENFNKTEWTTSGTGFVTQNVAIAPDGTLTADLLTDSDPLINLHWRQQSITIADDSTAYNFSIYLKEGNATKTQISAYCFNGTTVTTNILVTWATHTVSTGTIEDVGDGWYRISGTVTNNSTGNTSLIMRIYPAGAAVTDTGNVYTWGAQATLSTALYGYQKTEATSNTSLPSIAGIQLGELTELPHNAEVGFAVPTIAPKISYKTARSESGSFIGGSQLHKGVEGSINFTNIDPAWVRSDWEPFIVHVQTPAVFVMQWDNVTYTDEVVLAWGRGEVSSPTYSSPLYMNFSLDYEGTL